MMGVLAYFFGRLRPLERPTGDAAGPGGLGGRLAEMEEELLAVRREMRSLTERVDFTEKLLTGGDNDSASEGGAS